MPETAHDPILAAQIHNQLRREGMPVKASEIAQWLHVTPGRARRCLLAMVESGEVTKVENGDLAYYTLSGP